MYTYIIKILHNCYSWLVTETNTSRKKVSTQVFSKMQRILMRTKIFNFV